MEPEEVKAVMEEGRQLTTDKAVNLALEALAAPG
jgi:hypothetical protein